MSHAIYTGKGDVRRFDSPEAHLSFLQSIPSMCRNADRDTSWCGQPWDKALNLLAYGDTSLVKQAEAIIDKVKTENISAPQVALMLPSIVGFVPNVPAFISGHPEAMFDRRNMEVEGLNTPLSIYIDVVVSAGISHTEIMNKGIAILAFVMFMQAIRPVELYTISAGSADHGHWAQAAVTRIETRPLDLARACFMLTAPTYARRIAFSTVHGIAGIDANKSSMGWAWNAAFRGPGPRSEAFSEAMRELIGIEPHDLYIKPDYLYDNLMRNNPVAWVKQMIEKHVSK